MSGYAADPAEWLPALVRAQWDHAVASLKDDGVTFPIVPRPMVHAESDKAAVSIRNAVLIRAYEGGEESRTGHTHGYNTADLRITWILQVETHNAGKNARQVIHASKIILDRLLELHRKGPHEEWDLIEAWRWNTVADFWDYQKRACTLTLGRYGRVMATALKDVTG